MPAASHNLKQKLHTIIFRSDTPAGKRFDMALLALIITSILLVFMESIPGIRTGHSRLLRTLEWAFTVIFAIEYLLRIYCSKRTWHYIFSFYGLIDLLAILPSFLSLLFPGGQYLMVIRAVRLLRVFRIMKLTRFMNEGNVLGNALKASSHKIIVFLTCVLTLVSIIGTLMYLIEGEQSGFTSIPISIYWAIVTLTTVGYGDISPHSPLGQLLASCLMIIGYGIIAVPTGIVSVEMARATEQAKQTCTNCGLSLHSPTDRYCSNCGRPVEHITEQPTRHS